MFIQLSLCQLIVVYDTVAIVALDFIEINFYGFSYTVLSFWYIFSLVEKKEKEVCYIHWHTCTLRSERLKRSFYKYAWLKLTLSNEINRLWVSYFALISYNFFFSFSYGNHKVSNLKLVLVDD
jgi:hypothetical protein